MEKANRRGNILVVLLSVILVISLYFNIKSHVHTSNNSIIGTYQTEHYSKNKLVFIDASKVAHNYFNSETQQMVVEYGTYTIEKKPVGYTIAMKINDVSYILDCSENYEYISFMTYSPNDAMIVSLYSKISEIPILQD